MTFAIHLFFDPQAEAQIYAVWKELSDSGLAPYLYQSANRPHLTLAIYADLDREAARLRLEELARQTAPLLLSFQNFGIFPSPEAAVFLGPTVTAPLLDLHERINRRFADIGQQPERYYLPGNWIPHCALALELDRQAVQPVLEVGMRLLRLPLTGQITEIGLVEFRPLVHLCAFPLILK